MALSVLWILPNIYTHKLRYRKNPLSDEEQQTQTFSTKHKEVAFDRHIAKLLQKRTTQPILKTGVNELSGKESYEMLVQSTAVSDTIKGLRITKRT